LRTKFFDDYVVENANRIAKLGYKPQVVIAGAGLDTRALRLNWPKDTTVFELDRLELFKYKEERLNYLLLTIKPSESAAKRIIIPEDIASETWVDALIKKGYDKQSPSVWLTEGLLVYIIPNDAENLEKHIADLTVPNSAYAFDCQNTYSIQLNIEAVNIMKEMGAYLINPIDNPDKFIQKFGWSKVESNLFSSKAVDKSGRLIRSFLPRWFPAPKSFVVVALK